MDMSPKIARLLAEIGLQKRRSASTVVLPAIGVFAAGAVIGGLLGLLFAPSAGKKTRDEVISRLRARLHLDENDRGTDQNATA